MESIQAVFHALSDPTRLAVFQCIRCCGGSALYDADSGSCDGGTEGAVCVCDVRCQVPCAPSTLTHHLSVLRDAGLITTEKRGRNVYARIRPETLRITAEFLGSEK